MTLLIVVLILTVTNLVLAATVLRLQRAVARLTATVHLLGPPQWKIPAEAFTPAMLAETTAASKTPGKLYLPTGYREQWLEQHGTEPTTTGGDKMMD